jgi:tRNA pseudouridine13 synthase
VTAALPRAHGGPVLAARMRVAPEDFRVDEDLGFAASGAGEHLFLQVEKRGANTAWVAQQLARWAGIPEHGVSYAGLKDRHAVTTQAFTVHLPKRVAPEFGALDAHPDFRVLSHAWHARKLPRGALRGNRFGLLLREVQGERDAIEARLDAIDRRGVPNYFGEQRFGREGGNLAAARAMFAGKRLSRDQRSILLSAARSSIFNDVLARRVGDGSWEGGLEGDVWMLDGTHSVFGPEPMNDELRARAARLDLHATGPLWGDGELRSRDACAALEKSVSEQHADLAAGLVSAGLKQERRALRLPVRELRREWREDGLFLGFFLPAGAYATTVLHALGEVSGQAA